MTSRLQQGTDAAQVAAASVAVWHDIDRALNPVIGPKGVAALYHRSVMLTIDRHPWLGGAHRDALAALDLAALQEVLAQQPAAEAAAASTALFQAFRDLLANLIGTALTERLLGAVWARSSDEPPTQDTTS